MVKLDTNQVKWKYSWDLFLILDINPVYVRNTRYKSWLSIRNKSFHVSLDIFPTARMMFGFERIIFWKKPYLLEVCSHYCSLLESEFHLNLESEVFFFKNWGRVMNFAFSLLAHEKEVWVVSPSATATYYFFQKWNPH